eukprot:1951994-Prymnesium_polylepis.1
MSAWLSLAAYSLHPIESQNGLAMIGQFVYSTYEVDADALAMPTTPLDEVLRLRGQCESQAKQQQLYSR